MEQNGSGSTKRSRSRSFDTTSDSSSSQGTPGPQLPSLKDTQDNPSPSDSDDDDDDVGPPPPPTTNAKAASYDNGTSASHDGASLPATGSSSTAAPPPKKKRKVLPHEKTYLANLPSSERYFKSLMHRDVVNSVTVTPFTNFVITTSVDGWVKFWKKTSPAVTASSMAGSSSNRNDAAALEGISQVVEFVKQYRAHLAPIIAWSCSADGTMYATLGADSTVKIFDVVNFDLINMFKVSFNARSIEWIHTKNSPRTMLAITAQDFPHIHIFDGRDDGSSSTTQQDVDGADNLPSDQEESMQSSRPGFPAPISIVRNVHKHPVHLLTFNSKHNVVISCDTTGFVEYWVPSAPFSAPTGTQVPGIFTLKSQTDLFEFKKTKTVPTSLTFSPDGESFAILSIKDRMIRVFDFRTAKIKNRIDEGLETCQKMQSQEGQRVNSHNHHDDEDDGHGNNKTADSDSTTVDMHLDEMEFGRRIALERELGSSSSTIDADFGPSSTWNLLFDESSNFLIYASLFGIKFLNLATGAQCVRLLGKDEPLRFLHLALFQGGSSSNQKMVSIEAATSANPLLQKQLEQQRLNSSADATLFATCFQRNRFYMFTRFDPDQDQGNGDRDVFNEKPSREEQTIAAATSISHASRSNSTKGGTGAGGNKKVYNYATLHTTMGDIKLELFPTLVPRTVENFVGLCQTGYYDSVIFHRVIKKFMIQTGDPLGDGTGGQSYFSLKEAKNSSSTVFEDEFHPSLNHSKPFMVSMANSGPNTNGSQFFITTVPCPWLDNKHSIFGKVVNGLNTVTTIEQLPTDKNDLPRKPVSIVNVTLE